MQDRFQLSQHGKALLTREQGARVRASLEQIVAGSTGGFVIVDFDGVDAMTPSFLDECLGRLVLHLGPDVFRQRIRLEATNESLRRLANNVLAHRSNEARIRRASPTKKDT